MKVRVKGEGKTVEYNLYDTYDKASDTHSMARTTGYTCTAAVNLIAQGHVHRDRCFSTGAGRKE
jgi:hypothetical protein